MFCFLRVTDSDMLSCPSSVMFLAYCVVFVTIILFLISVLLTVLLIIIILLLQNVFFYMRIFYIVETNPDTKL